MGRKFLIIDDSALMRRVISDIIKQNSEYEVLDVACDGEEGYEKISSKPGYYDLILMDINMPRMNGIEMLDKLYKNRMKETIVVVSTVAKSGAKETIRALELGAVDFVTKPGNFYDTKSDRFKDSILRLVDMACSKYYHKNKVVTTQTVPPERPLTTRSVRESSAPVADSKIDLGGDTKKTSVKQNISVSTQTKTACTKKLVALACSTGGPKSLQQVIPYLPANLDAAVVMVQHMPKGFTASLATRLNAISDITVQEAQDGDVIENGNVYIAPGGMHIKVEKSGSKYVIRFEDIPAIDGLKPCANVMYRSLVSSGFEEITCVVLTGMGADGTAGIKALAEAGHNIHVIGQDEESCVVYGMPRAIAEAGLIDEVVPLNKIAERIIKNVGVS